MRARKTSEFGRTHRACQGREFKARTRNTPDASSESASMEPLCQNSVSASQRFVVKLIRAREKVACGSVTPTSATFAV